MLKPVMTMSGGCSMWDAFLDEMKTEFVPTEADAVPLDDLFAFDSDSNNNNNNNNSNEEDEEDVDEKKESVNVLEEDMNVLDDVLLSEESDDQLICSLKSLKRDCMWSSAHNHTWSQQQSSQEGGQEESQQISCRRSRNGSLSVSECAESVFKEVSDVLLSSSPSSLSKLLLHDDVFETVCEDSLSKKIRSRSNSNNNNQFQREGSSNSNCNSGTRVGRERPMGKANRQFLHHHVEAGRSLLRSKQHINNNNKRNNGSSNNAKRSLSNNGVIAVMNDNNSNDSCSSSNGSSNNNVSGSSQCQRGDIHSHHLCPNTHQTIIDHSYFLPIDGDNESSSQMTMVSSRLGLLTPNDTSDDDDDGNGADEDDCSNNISRKRKRPHDSNEFVDALLVRCRAADDNDDNTENLSPFIDEWAAATCADDPTTLATRAFGNIRLERKKKSKLSHSVNGSNSALKNVPASSSSSTPSNSNPSSPTIRRNKTHRSRSTADPKSQEVRASHNNMERLRRVDLRQHFEQLKELVPELCREERASKVTILNKAQNHCRALNTLHDRLKAEKEKEECQLRTLKHKLQQLRASIDGQYSRRRTSRR